MKTLSTILLLFSGAAATAQSTWFVRSGDEVRVVGPTSVVVRGIAPAPFATGNGEFVVHFAADAAGKPGSLRLGDVHDALVQVAVDVVGPAPGEVLAFDAPVWREQRVDGAVTRLVGERDVKNVRLAAELRADTDAEVVGLIVRAQSDGGHYRYEWDRGAHEHRLLRRMGGNDLVLARAEDATGAPPHRVALQADGFRLQVCCDDAVVLQALDGGFEDGMVGTWQRGGAPAWAEVRVQAPALPRASAALVRTAAGATLHAWVPSPPGSISVLELRLDRPHPLVPMGPAGELWLLQPTVGPVLARGDWRNSLGSASIGEVDREGLVRAEVALTDLPALRGAACLVRAVIVDAVGEAISGATPFVPLWWPATAH
ncbi:MAG: hypothetical protein H6838_03355 [Planctomycetes bacterium]|nr:hypothetical protein [Planctomycetota bacterium]MCB9884500.1 hypothetical protein [Planctomycetota bacterium]